MEATKDIILIYGAAEARPIDRESTPHLRFQEGSVVGNLSLPSLVHKRHQSDDQKEYFTALQRLKSEQSFRKNQHLYSKVKRKLRKFRALELYVYHCR